MKCPRSETCHHCRAWGQCWWIFPPPWRLCAICYEDAIGRSPEGVL